MTVKDLIEKLQRIGKDDMEVCVRVTNTLSPYTGEPVINLYQGFDWEMGKVMLCTDSKLIRVRDACKQCGLYNVKSADISSRVDYIGEKITFYHGKKKVFSVPLKKKEVTDV